MGGDILVRLFLRILALLYFIGFLLHAGDLFDLRLTFSEMNTLWKYWIIFLIFMDGGAAIGLLFRKPFGVGLFLMVAMSQLVAYIGFEKYFGSQISLIIFHLVSLGIYFSLWFVNKKKTADPCQIV
jgi:hypothetical protein